MAKRKGGDKGLRELAAYERFIEVQLGVYPATIAALKLGMTTSGVFNAAERGHLTFFQIGRNRWYGRKDVINYRHEVSRKFRDNRRQPSDSPRDYLAEFLTTNPVISIDSEP